MTALTGDAESAFSRMLDRAGVPYNNVQCPRGDDELTISLLRKHAVKVNRELGNTIVEFDWRPDI